MANGLQYNDIQTAQQGMSRDQIAQAAQGNLNNTITSDQLKPTTPVNLTTPPPTGSPDALAASVADTPKTIDQYIKSLTPAPTAADTQQQGILDSIASLTGQDTGKQQYDLQQQQANGVPDLQRQLSDLNGQITTGNAEYQKMAADEAAQNAALEANGRGLSTAVVTGQQGAVQRQFLAQKAAKAADLALVAARAQAVSGNIQTALMLAGKATDAKFQPIEDALKVKQAQLSAIQPILDKQDKVQALALQRQYDDQKQALADQKATQKDAVSYALQNNVQTPFFTHAGTIFRTVDGKAYSSPAEFFADGGAKDFSNAPTTNPTPKPVTVSEGQTLVDPTTGKVIYHSPKTYAPSSGGGGPSGPSVTTIGGNGVVAGTKVDNSVAGDIEDVLSGRNTLFSIRQTMGKSNQSAEYMKQLRNGIRAVDPKFDFVASDAGGKFVSTEYFQKSLSAINNVLPDIKIVTDLSDEVSRVGVKGVDSLLQSGKVQINNKKVANFHEAQKILADSIGLALGQGTVSDMKLQLGFDITDPSVSPEVFASNMAIVQQFIENRKQALNDQRYQSSTVPDASGTSGDDQAYQEYLKAVGGQF